jgi:hypothetical protein
MLKERKTWADASDTKGARADHPDGEGWDALGQRRAQAVKGSRAAARVGSLAQLGGVKAKREAARGRQVVE